MTNAERDLLFEVVFRGPLIGDACSANEQGGTGAAHATARTSVDR